MIKRFYLRIIVLCVLALAIPALAMAVPNPQSGKEIDRATWVPTIDVVEINDHVLAFYDGRDIAGDPPFADNYNNWAYYGAMDLGLCSYVIYQGDTALIYDTMTVPEQAIWVRKYLEDRGIKHFTIALSHWHVDHVAGNEIYKDCDIIATRATYDALVKNKAAMEAGELLGPPAIKPLILPNVIFDKRLDFYVGDILVEMHHFNIHSPDGNVLYLPADKILFSGDTLEDTVTVVSESELAAGTIFMTYMPELRRMLEMDIERIYPNHGSLEMIKGKGYPKTFITATINYLTRLVERSKDKDFLEKNADLRTFIKDELDKGWVYYFDAYESVHKRNLQKVQKYYQDKPLPKL